MGKAFICIYGAIYALSDGDGRIGACSFCDPVEEDDVMRISAKSIIAKCIGRTIRWLTVEKQDRIKLTSTGNAIWKAITIAEIVKHRIKGIHQFNTIKTLPTIDEYKPLEEGLDVVKIERNLACLQMIPAARWQAEISHIAQGKI